MGSYQHVIKVYRMTFEDSSVVLFIENFGGAIFMVDSTIAVNGRVLFEKTLLEKAGPYIYARHIIQVDLE